MTNDKITIEGMKRTVLTAVVVSAIGLVLSYLIIHEAYESEKLTAQTRFESDAKQIVNRIETQLGYSLDNANQIIALKKAVKNLTSAQFASFVKSSSQINDYQTNIAYGAVVPIAERLQYEAKATEIGGIPFKIKNASGGFDFPDAQYLYPIVQIWSKDDGDAGRFVMIDMGGIPILKQGLQLLMDSRRPVALPIMNRIGGVEFDGPFFFFLTPVLDAGHKLITGYISQVIYVSEAMEDILYDLKFNNLTVSISNVDMHNSDDVVDFDSQDSVDQSIDFLGFERGISVAQKNWIVTVRSSGENYLPALAPVIMVTIISVLLTVWAVYFVWRQGRRTAIISRMVDKRTAALSEAHVELENHYETLQAMNIELDAARRTAEESNTAKSGFLTTVSHELRTPLNAILGFSQIIKDETLGKIEEDKYVEYARDINESGIHLLSLINNILDLAKLEAGKLNIDSAVVSMASVIDGALRIVRHGASEKDIELRLKLSDELPEYIIGDEVRLKQILINLLSNSVKFTDAGYIELAIYLQTYIDGSPSWVIEVTDTGIGIGKAEQTNLFERFTQVEDTKSRKFGGSGLGLAICKELVVRMGGEITITSDIGKGSKFKVTLPLMDAESATDDNDNENDMI